MSPPNHRKHTVHNLTDINRRNLMCSNGNLQVKYFLLQDPEVHVAFAFVSFHHSEQQLAFYQRREKFNIDCF